jgi:hypothetical protein
MARAKLESQIYIFPAAILETNEWLQDHTHQNAVDTAEFLKGANKIVRQIRAAGLFGDAYKTVVRGKEYIVFKGMAGMRPRLPGTRYLGTNPKVAMFVVGEREIIKDATPKMVAVFAYVAIDIMQEVLTDHVSLARLGVKVASDIAKAILASVAGALAGVVLVTAGAPVVITFVFVVAVGTLAGMTLDYYDEKYKITKTAVARMMAFEDDVKAKIDRTEREINRDVAEVRRLAAIERYAADRFFNSIEDFLQYGQFLE